MTWSSPGLLRKHTINLPHDPLRSLNRSGDQRLGSRAGAAVKQIVCGFQVTRHEDSRHNCQHALSTFVHGRATPPCRRLGCRSPIRPAQCQIASNTRRKTNTIASAAISSSVGLVTSNWPMRHTLNLITAPILSDPDLSATPDANDRNEMGIKGFQISNLRPPSRCRILFRQHSWTGDGFVVRSVMRSRHEGIDERAG